MLGTQSDRLVEETDGSQRIMQQLKFKGNELKDYKKTLTDYKIQFESTIDMQVSFLFIRCMGAWIPDKMMSVAAGGTIKQSIIEDKNDPRVWNTDKVKLINVQIINSALFEEITGMAMPPTPVSLQTYVSKGLPFFDIYNETPTNVTGSFGNVRTVSEMDSVRGARASMVYDPTRPQICGACSVRMRDCMSVTFCYSLFILGFRELRLICGPRIRPCDHCLCRVCAVKISGSGRQGTCPTCHKTITRIVGISSPMNAPGHEAMSYSLPVVMLDVVDRRERFKSIVPKTES